MGVSALFRSVGPKALQATPLKQWVNRSSLAVAATTERSPPAPSQQTAPSTRKSGSLERAPSLHRSTVLDEHGRSSLCDALQPLARLDPCESSWD